MGSIREALTHGKEVTIYKADLVRVNIQENNLKPFCKSSILRCCTIILTLP